MNVKKPTYQQAVVELESIIERMEKGETGLDQLIDEVKRATALLQACKEKLYATEREVNKVLGEMEQ